MNVVDVPRLLEPIEEDYVRRVAWHLRDINAKRRGELVVEVRWHLRERPAPEGEEALWHELGPPSDYARELRAVHELGDERTDWWARWLAIPYRQRWLRAVAAVVVLGSVVVGAAAMQWWVTWQADITPFMSGIAWADTNGVADPIDRSGIESEHRFESRIVTVDVSDRRDVVLKVGILMGRTPRRVSMPQLDHADAAGNPSITLVSATIEPQIGSSPAGVGPVPGAYIVELHLRANCGPAAGPPGESYSYSVGWVHVDYEGLGRSRSADVQLLETVQFQWPGSLCGR